MELIEPCRIKSAPCSRPNFFMLEADALCLLIGSFGTQLFPFLTALHQPHPA